MSEVLENNTKMVSLSAKIRNLRRYRNICKIEKAAFHKVRNALLPLRITFAVNSSDRDEPRTP